MLLAPVLGRLSDRAGLAAAAHLAPLLVLDALLETALGHVLVDLGAADVIASADYIDCCFLAAFERSHNPIDDAVVDQGLQTGWNLHQVGFLAIRDLLRGIRNHRRRRIADSTEQAIGSVMA